MTKKLLLGAAALAFTFTSAFSFAEYPVGEAKTVNKMEIAAVYLQPIDMEPRGIDLPASKADIHLEADIHATKGNKNGFGAGEWIPYLTITYKVTNLSTGKTKVGALMPMVAADGPHYGSNMKMMGVGKYKIEFNIEPPSKQGFGRHSDKETGVGKWFQPFSVSFTGKYKGIKK